MVVIKNRIQKCCLTAKGNGGGSAAPPVISRIDAWIVERFHHCKVLGEATTFYERSSTRNEKRARVKAGRVASEQRTSHLQFAFGVDCPAPLRYGLVLHKFSSLDHKATMDIVNCAAIARGGIQRETCVRDGSQGAIRRDRPSIRLWGK